MTHITLQKGEETAQAPVNGSWQELTTETLRHSIQALNYRAFDASLSAGDGVRCIA